METDKPLAGKVALVAGGAGGIGTAICAALQRDGAEAVSLDREQAKAEGVESLKADVTDDTAVRTAVEKVRADKGCLDLLVYAAGISHDAVVWKMPVEDWDRILSVNLRGAFLCVRQIVPVMREGGGGRIVLIGSINGSRGKFGTAAYSASKAGLLGLCKTVAREVARFNILINVVEPGWVRTPLTMQVPQEIQDAAARESLLGRLLEPEDVAETVRFLCGPGAGSITGQILRVDGGQFLGPS